MDHKINQYYVETWINSLSHVTIPTTSFDLTTQQLQLIKSVFDILYSHYFAQLKKIQKQESQRIPLGKNNWLLLPCVSHLVESPVFTNLVQKCRTAMSNGQKYFVKLSLRSAKDSLCLKKYQHIIQDSLKQRYDNCRQQSYRLALVVNNPLSGLEQIMTSQRINDDIDLHLKHHKQQPLKLHFRVWLQIPHSLQFRIFINERKLTAISSYYKMELYPYLKKYKQQIQQQIEGFFQKQLKHQLALESVVMDIGFAIKGNQQILAQAQIQKCLQSKDYKIVMIEINPFGKMSGGALFSWQEKVLFNGPLEFRLSHEQHIL